MDKSYLELAYQLKTVDADVLQYLSSDASYRLSSVEVTENNVSHFSKVLATDNNMTVVIEDAAWDVLPTEGSELAAFDKAGNLIGSAIYSSPVTVVTVWGDDAMTSEKEGSLVSEAVSFKVFTSGDIISSDRVLLKVINALGQEVNIDDDQFEGGVLFAVYNDGTVKKVLRE